MTKRPIEESARNIIRSFLGRKSIKKVETMCLGCKKYLLDIVACCEGVMWFEKLLSELLQRAEFGEILDDDVGQIFGLDLCFC